MATLMVWDYQDDQDSENDYAWNRVPTEYKVGSRAELLYWRVKANGDTSKDFFYSPHDYEAFSGVSIDQYKVQVDAWTEQHKAALKEFDITQTNTNATIVSNGRSYASFFPTEQPIGSTVS